MKLKNWIEFSISSSLQLASCTRSLQPAPLPYLQEEYCVDDVQEMDKEHVGPQLQGGKGETKMKEIC